MFQKVTRSEKGNALTEYAMIGAVIVVICIGALQLLGFNILETITRIATAI